MSDPMTFNQKTGEVVRANPTAPPVVKLGPKLPFTHEGFAEELERQERFMRWVSGEDEPSACRLHTVTPVT